MAKGANKPVAKNESQVEYGKLVGNVSTLLKKAESSGLAEFHELGGIVRDLQVQPKKYGAKSVAKLSADLKKIHGLKVSTNSLYAYARVHAAVDEPQIKPLAEKGWSIRQILQLTGKQVPDDVAADLIKEAAEGKLAQADVKKVLLERVPGLRKEVVVPGPSDIADKIHESLVTISRLLTEMDKQMKGAAPEKATEVKHSLEESGKLLQDIGQSLTSVAGQQKPSSDPPAV